MQSRAVILSKRERAKRARARRKIPRMRTLPCRFEVFLPVPVVLRSGHLLFANLSRRLPRLSRRAVELAAGEPWMPWIANCAFELAVPGDSLIHEEISEGIFDEINNVVDVNRVLAKGQQQFLLGPPVYYRIYAERHHVLKGDEELALLFHSAMCDLYAPAMFWTLTLREETIARELAQLYLHPKSPQIYVLIRTAVLLGKEFCDWLYGKWHSKWKHYSQPPGFYFSFAGMIAKLSGSDPRLIAARATPSAQFVVTGEPIAQAEALLGNPQLAASLLSKACMRVFQGQPDMRSVARNLDYFAYGMDLRDRATKIKKAVMDLIGNQEAGDFAGTSEEE